MFCFVVYLSAYMRKFLCYIACVLFACMCAYVVQGECLYGGLFAIFFLVCVLIYIYKTRTKSGENANRNVNIMYGKGCRLGGLHKTDVLSFYLNKERWRVMIDKKDIKVGLVFRYKGDWDDEVQTYTIAAIESHPDKCACYKGHECKEYFVLRSNIEEKGEIVCETKSNGDGSDIELHKQLLEKLHDTYKRKNHDYGNAFSEMYDELGFDYGYGKIREKVNRIKALKNVEAKVAGEPLEDALLDCANYCILTLMEYQKRKA